MPILNMSAANAITIRAAARLAEAAVRNAARPSWTSSFPRVRRRDRRWSPSGGGGACGSCGDPRVRAPFDELMMDSEEAALRRAIAAISRRTLSQASPQVQQGRMKPTDAGLHAIIVLGRDLSEDLTTER